MAARRGGKQASQAGVPKPAGMQRARRINGSRRWHIKLSDGSPMRIDFFGDEVATARAIYDSYAEKLTRRVEEIQGCPLLPEQFQRVTSASLDYLAATYYAQAAAEDGLSPKERAEMFRSAASSTRLASGDWEKLCATADDIAAKNDAIDVHAQASALFTTKDEP